jgi:lipopolysaccharide transport system permease protein
VVPGADVKIFLTASAEERALRRHKQLEEKGLDVSLADVSQEILERDRRDSTRAVAPLRPAEGAVVIDSTGLAIEAVVDRILAVARGRLGAHATASRPQVPTVHIAAGRTDLHVVGDLWRFRELFYFLAWRDVLVRYRQTAIGIAWALLRPLLTLVVFTLVFGKLAGLPSAGIPYPILVCAALVPWQFFASALNDCSNSLLASAELLSKVYFPRLVIPGSALVVSLVDLVISMVILAGLMVAYGFMPDWRVLTLPIFVLLAVMLAFGAGLWFAALSVEFRDFRYIVPFVLQFGLFVSPVGFASAVIPEQWRLLYALNPLVGVIDGFRWALLRGEPALPVPSLALSIGIAVLLVASGLWHFRRTERKFADVI